jgi:[ribosomal protein S5]-alanine N-acetyltransferase
MPPTTRAAGPGLRLHIQYRIAAMTLPTLSTARLTIRPFTPDDLAGIYRILDVELDGAPAEPQGPAWQARQRWLAWTVENYHALAALAQPPYGDRAVALNDDARLIGAVGLVPILAPFEQLPGWPVSGGPGPARLTAEVGLYWALSPVHQRRGYATEAAQALIDYAFDVLRLRRIVATTDYDNTASQAVMRRLGMTLLRNPLPEPCYFQVAAVLEAGE